MGPRAGLDGRKISSHRDSIPDRPARSQSLYRLSYPAHGDLKVVHVKQREAVVINSNNVIFLGI